MTGFLAKARDVLRCAFTRDCPLRMTTRNPTINRLREEEVAARASTNEIQRRHTAASAPSVFDRDLIDLFIPDPRRGGRHQ